jgi:GxxExxY protein
VTILRDVSPSGISIPAYRATLIVNLRAIRRGEHVADCAGMDLPAHINNTTHNILGGAIEVHRCFGPGLLEAPYVEGLELELSDHGLRYQRQRAAPLVYKGHALTASYRIDLVIEDLVIVEVKAIERVLPVHEAQLITYLRVTELPVGLLINFNVARLMDGVVRRVNTKSTRRGEPA